MRRSTSRASSADLTWAFWRCSSFIPGCVVYHHRVPAPGHDRDVGGLSEDGGTDLVAEVAHGGGRGPEEGDACGGEGGGESGIFRGVAPARPHRVRPRAEREVYDEGHVGVVVGVGASRHLLKHIGQAYVLGACLQVFGGGHGYELNLPLVPERFERPLAHRADGLDCSDAIVGH
jgi:hypothetical protein